MNATQCDFDFTAKRMPVPAAAEVDQLIDFLLWASAKDWVNAKQIAASLGYNERKIRSLAQHSEGIIISGPGCPGYRHISHCTGAQVREVSDRMKSQAKAMLRRSIRLKNLAHSIIS
jgi:hypothetical protein